MSSGKDYQQLLNELTERINPVGAEVNALELTQAIDYPWAQPHQKKTSSGTRQGSVRTKPIAS